MKTATTKELLDAIEGATDQSGKLNFLFGAGISQNVFLAAKSGIPEPPESTEQQEAEPVFSSRDSADWSKIDGLLWGNLLNAWFQYLEQFGLEGNRTDHIRRLINSGENVEELLAAAFMIRERLRVEGLWDGAIETLFTAVLEPMVDSLKDSAWGRFFLAMEASVSKRRRPMPFLKA